MCDDFFDIGWEEMALAGSLAEEIADEERDRRKRETEMEEHHSCCCEDCEDFDPPDKSCP